MANMSLTEEKYAKWRYQTEIPPNRDFLLEAWNLLETYSHVPPDEVEDHIIEVRNKAWAIYKYPCIGRWRFLNLYLARLPIYNEIVSRVAGSSTSPPQTFLDAGCCFGQVLRQVAYDSGCPQTNLYGCDLKREFIDLGYDLFRDKSTFGAHFFTGNMLLDDEQLTAEEKEMYAGLNGKIDIIHAASFYHLFGWDDQIKLGIRMVKMFKPNAQALILGRQVGDLHPMSVAEHRKQVAENPGQFGVNWYRHNLESWQMLWDDIGHKTGTKWKSETEMMEFHPEADDEEQIAKTGIRFVVRRVD